MKYAITLVLCLLASTALAQGTCTTARKGGTADWKCCTDSGCTAAITQHADEFRVQQACMAQALAAKKKNFWMQSNIFEGTCTYPTTPPPPPPSVDPPPDPPPPPPSTTGSLTVSWEAPTRNEDGTVLDQNQLSGFRIYYGTDAANLDQVVSIVPWDRSRVVSNLVRGRVYFFAMTAYTDAGGSESRRTNILSGVVP